MQFFLLRPFQMTPGKSSPVSGLSFRRLTLDRNPPGNIALYTFSLGDTSSMSLAASIRSSDPSVSISPSSFILGGDHPINQIVTIWGDSTGPDSVAVQIGIEGLPSQSLAVERPQTVLELSVVPSSLTLDGTPEGSAATFVVSLNRSSLSPVAVSLITPDPAIRLSPSSFSLGGANPIERTVTITANPNSSDSVDIRIDATGFASQIVSIKRTQALLELSADPSSIILDRVAPGNVGTFRASLNRVPSSPVMVNVSTSDPSVEVSPVSFSLSTGDPPSQTLTVTGNTTGPESVAIELNVAGQSPKTVTVTRPPFTPVAIPGLALWLDASDSSSLTLDSSNNVTRWDDKSGNSRHLGQQSALLCPQYVANAINGLSVVRTDGVDDILSSAAFPPEAFFGPSGNSITVISLLRRASLSPGINERFAWLISRTSTGSRDALIYDRLLPARGTSDFVIRNATGGIRMTSAPHVNSTDLAIETIYWTSGDYPRLRRYIGGTTSTYQAEGILGGAMAETLQVYIGSASSARGSFDFAEFMVWPRVLTPAEIGQVESQLVAKWGAM